MRGNPFPNKRNTWLSEDQVIDILINDDKEKGRVDFRHFFNVVSSPFEYEEFYNYKGVYIAKNVKREELGFSSETKPGDFDLILIPYSATHIYFERTAVYEIKVVRPKRTNPKKSPNSMGITQLKGLIADGFPFVSLMHICMTEPLEENEKMEIKFCTLPANGEPIPGGIENLEDHLIDVKMDYFSWWSADNQMKRLIAEDIPKYAGLSTFGLNIHENGEYSLTSCSVNLADFQSGYFNPHKKIETVEKIKLHFEKFSLSYKKISIRE